MNDITPRIVVNTKVDNASARARSRVHLVLASGKALCGKMPRAHFSAWQAVPPDVTIPPCARCERAAQL